MSSPTTPLTATRHSAAGPATRYTKVAIALHWLTALAIAGLILLGLVMTQMPLDLSTRFRLYQLHKSIGITVLLVTLGRILWRLGHPPPALPEGMPRFEHLAARHAHLLLYGLMVGLPASGWALASVSVVAIPTVLYGVMPWPSLPVLSSLADKAPAEALLASVHAYGAWILVGLVAVHVGAAARHQLVRRDDLMRRMWPSRGDQR